MTQIRNNCYGAAPGVLVWGSSAYIPLMWLWGVFWCFLSFLWSSCFPGGIRWPLYLSLTRDVRCCRVPFNGSNGRDDRDHVIDGPSGMVYKFRSSGRISGIGWRQKQKVLNSGKLKAELCSLLSKGKTWSTSSLNLLYLHTNRKRKSVRQLNKQKHPSTLKKTLNKVQESALHLRISIIFDSWGWLQSYFYVTLQINVRTYEDLLPLVCSCMSSPLGLTVKILQSGTPTSL